MRGRAWRSSCCSVFRLMYGVGVLQPLSAGLRTCGVFAPPPSSGIPVPVGTLQGMGTRLLGRWWNLEWNGMEEVNKEGMDENAVHSRS